MPDRRREFRGERRPMDLHSPDPEQVFCRMAPHKPVDTGHEDAHGGLTGLVEVF